MVIDSNCMGMILKATISLLKKKGKIEKEGSKEIIK